MIDVMVGTLKEEEKDDVLNKEYCNGQLDVTDDKEKAMECSLEDAETAIESAEPAIATLKGETAAMETSIKDFDKAGTEATDQQKAEHEEFLDLMASNTCCRTTPQFLQKN